MLHRLKSESETPVVKNEEAWADVVIKGVIEKGSTDLPLTLAVVTGKNIKATIRHNGEFEARIKAVKAERVQDIVDEIIGRTGWKITHRVIELRTPPHPDTRGSRFF